jgi:hypothetical protein
VERHRWLLYLERYAGRTTGAAKRRTSPRPATKTSTKTAQPGKASAHLGPRDADGNDVPASALSVDGLEVVESPTSAPRAAIPNRSTTVRRPTRVPAQDGSGAT